MQQEARWLQEAVNLDAFPLLEPGGEAWRRKVEAVRGDLSGDGCSVLRRFIRPELIERLRAEGEAVAPLAYYQSETVNAYNLPLDADLPADHPARITMQRGNAFVARDLVPQDAIIHRLYDSVAFRNFLADCFSIDKLYQLADPLAGLCVNVLKPGCSHPWHYDINEFTVSLLTRKAEGGGSFDFCPNIRSPQDENLDAVRDVMTGKGAHLVRHLELRPGDLQLFKGRYSLHRVSPVEGAEARHTAIFAYTLEPGVIGTPDRTKQLFGRFLPAHEEAARNKVRADTLLD